jgi:uncharacterized membrane protein
MECPSCHTVNSTGSKFCQNCGAALGEAPSGTASYTEVPPNPAPAYSTPGAAYGQAPTLQGGLSDNAAGAIAYLTIIPAIVFLLVEPYRSRPFVRFHSVQCLGLALFSIAGHLVLAFLPFHVWTLSSLFSLFIFVLWVIAIVSAGQGKWFKLPAIGDIAEQQSRR